MFLVGLENKFIVELDELYAASFLAGEYDVTVLAEGHRSRHVLEFEDPLHWFKSLAALLIILFTSRRLSKLVDVYSRRDCGRQ